MEAFFLFEFVLAARYIFVSNVISIMWNFD